MWRRITFALALVLAAASLGPARASADASCNGAAMYVVAHQDDSLLFQSPSLPQAIQSARCVRTVFLTAGDAGYDQTYWGIRERGVEAAYAQIAGVPDAWTTSTLSVRGHPLRLETLNGSPRISLVFMRLPDGGFPAGLGTPRYGDQSLKELWNGGNGLTPAIAGIDAVDHSTSYGYQDLIDTLTELMTAFEPSQVATQNHLEAFGAGNDHSDHAAAARFAELAHRGYHEPHQFTGYQGYDTSSSAPNVSGDLLAAKQSAFYLYGGYDNATCDDGPSCDAGSYGGWLTRQYVVGTRPVGVVANAGSTRVAYPGDAVTLDGSLSSTARSAGLSYAWTQVGGPAIALSSAASAHPSFAAPAGPVKLTFALTVSDGVQSGAADRVTITVAGGREVPQAAAAAARSVASDATVTLDASGSSDPYGQPLSYAWTQTAGPAVTLSETSAERPTFTAPPGPATLRFSLLVSNGAASSAPATVEVTVAAARADETNLAARATASASSESAADGQFAASAIDGVVDGYPGDVTREWASVWQGAGSWLKLTWTSPQLLDHVVLYDRRNANDRITSGTLTFSDGTSVPFAALPGDAATGRVATFPPHVTTSLTMTVTGVSPTTQSAGLAELQAWGVPARAPEITSAAAADFTAGSAGSFTIAATGDPKPRLSASALPAGLELTDHGDGTATLAGTPLAASTDTISVTAASAAGTATQALALTVAPAPASPAPAPASPGGAAEPRVPRLSAARVDVVSGRGSRHIVAIEGAGAEKVSVSGKLPRGLRARVDSRGRVVLTATRAARTAGDYRLTVRVGARTLRLTVRLAAGRRPSLTVRRSVTARAGHALRVRIAAGGFPAPRITAAGKLPPGLHLTTSRAGATTLNGTPTRRGRTTVTLRARNAAGSARRTLTVVVR